MLDKHKQKSHKKKLPINLHSSKIVPTFASLLRNKPQSNKGDSLAQLVEHIPFKDGVVGSNPTRITKGSSLTPSGDSFFMSIPIYHSTTYIL